MELFKRKFYWIIALGGVLAALTVVICKENYHMDEIFSYTLSNYDGAILMDFEEGITYPRGGSAWEIQMTVNRDTRFNVDQVWLNQKADVHPPMYYLILNLVCSAFPGKFSKWFAGSINLFFFLASMIYVYKLACCLNQSRLTASLVLAYFAFCYGIIHMNGFFRMYIMALFWIILIVYLQVGSLRKEKWDFKYYLSMMLTACFGALTHYYVSIFLVLQSAAWILALLLLHKRKECAIYIGVMACAGLHAVLLFPYMIYHIFTGGMRGKQAFENFGGAGGDRLITFFKIMNTQLFGNCLIFIALLFLAVCFLSLCRKKKKKTRVFWKDDAKKKELLIWSVVIIPCIGYFFLVSKTAAYLTDRYMYPIYGLLVVLGISGICQETRFLLHSPWYGGAAAICLLLLLLRGYQYADWPYLYRNDVSRSALENADEYKECSCIYVFEEKWKCTQSFLEIVKYKDSTFVKPEQLENFRSLDSAVVVYFPRNDKTEIYLRKWMECNPQFTVHKVISEFSSYEVGYLFRENDG